MTREELNTLLNPYSDKYNSHPRQTEHLYNLCNGDLDELNLLFIKIYLLSFNTKIPKNEKEYNVYKQASLKFQHKNGLLGEMLVPYGLLYVDRIYVNIPCKWYADVNRKAFKNAVGYFWTRRYNLHFLDQHLIENLKYL